MYSPSGGLAQREIAGPLGTLHHRGPDGAGSWCSPSGRAVLGHTRLAVVDLETGDQPIGTDGGDLQIVVSGEFYGYRAIRAELAARGRTLLTRSDSEIALHLYALDERKALARLRGEFALVLWDERRGELLAARDRFGIKPLFYAERGGRLYLASEVKALLAAGVPARWDVDSFADHLQVSVPQGGTLFAGIRQVPPGCLLAAGAGGVRLVRYWDLDYPPLDRPPAFGALDEYLDVVRDAVADAVLVRTTADIPVGYHLSGGLDSSSVVAIAGRVATPTAFTVRFDDAEYDESAVAARTAAFLGAKHHEIPCRRSDFAGHLLPTVRAGEMIQENSHGVARYLQSAGIRASGYQVVLAGEGGDELFAGYPQFQADLALTLSPAARARAATGYAKLETVGTPRHLSTLLGALGLVPNWVLDRYMNVTSPIRALLRDDFAERLAARDACAGLLADAAGQLDGRAFIHQSQYLFAKSWLCNYILAAERLDMAHAVEVRLPFLDHQLFEAVRAAPVEWYTRHGQTKFPLREAMRPHLPREVSDGGKQGFFAPPAIEDDAAFAVLRELVADPSARDNPFFDHGRVTAAVDRIAGDPRQRGRSERLLQIVAGSYALAGSYGMTAA
jgi:asparagine synthase (glutamine-hydrolysing)